MSYNKNSNKKYFMINFYIFYVIKIYFILLLMKLSLLHLKKIYRNLQPRIDKCTVIKVKLLKKLQN